MREGRYWITVTASGSQEPLRLSFDGVAERGQEHVERGAVDVPLMKDGRSDRPLDVGRFMFVLPAKQG